jgi:hypothetical protein
MHTDTFLFRALQVKGPDDPRWNSVWYRPWNRRSIRPRFFMRGNIAPQNGRYKELCSVRMG